MNWQGKQVLVTGGTGFVGAHLVEALVRQGAQVTSTFQTTEPLSYFNSRKLGQQVTLSHTNIADFEALFDLITKCNIEYVFHLAAQPLVEVAYFNPRHTLEVNIMGTVNVLEASRLYPVIKSVVVASSDKAYGKLHGGKYLETTPLRGDHPYDVSKSATDLIALSYAKTYGLPITVSRFGNIYGEGDMNLSRIIPGIMNALITKQTLQLRSDGSFIRDYLHVTDVVAGYLALAQQADKIQGEAFNFGSIDTCSVIEVINIAQKVLKRKVPYTILNTSKNEIPYQSLDFTKAQQLLGWQPVITLKKALPKLLRYYQSVLT